MHPNLKLMYDLAAFIEAQRDPGAVATLVSDAIAEAGKIANADKERLFIFHYDVGDLISQKAKDNIRHEG